MNTKNACDLELNERIASANRTIKSAYECLKHRDFLQCAVRLQELEKSGRFSELEMNVFEAESDDEEGR